MPTTFDKSFGSEAHHGGRVRKTTAGKYVAERSIDGKVRRQTFESRKAAIEHLKKTGRARGKHGEIIQQLTGRQMRDAVDALHTLEESGKSVSLRAAVDYWIKHHPDVEERVTLEELVTAYENELRNPTDGGDAARPASVRNKRRRLGTFLNVHGEKDIRQLTKADVEEWELTFAELAPRTRLNRKAELQSVLNFAQGTEKRPAFVPGYTNTLCKVYQRRGKGAAGAAILTPAQAEAMLRHIEANKPGRYALTFALYLFAGLRPQELIPRDGKNNPMQWGSIRLDKGKIFVLPEVSKTGHDRQVTICDNLRAWIERYPGAGRIAPEANAFDGARRKAAKEAGVKKWAQNLTRHSYGTYAAELNGIHAAAESMGHMTGLSVFKRHYEGRTSQKDAEKFFGIMPD
ncbi:MAG: site-specific integrase, partial [Kiritimatiellae bacterium]|jgi:integrase|nr:site-specific integrase [Kiritimatiellia bacterium]